MPIDPKDIGPRKGETSEQYKERIEETKREFAREEAAAAPAAPAAPPLMPSPATPPVQEQVLPPAPVAAAPVPPAAPSVPKPFMATGKPEVDEWLGKKGFKSLEEMVQSQREMEREFHQKRAQERQTPPAPQVPPPAAPAPGYPPYYPAVPPQAPAYAYPPAPYPVYPGYAPVPPQPNVEELARRYGINPEDFEKVAAVANDLAESKIDQRLRAVLPPLMNQVQSVNREVGRQRELVNLMSDPSFKNPQVQYEMHRVLEENPAIFENQSLPYRYAFDQALMRIARANLGGSNAVPAAPTPPAPAPPTGRPPVTAGGNGGGGGGAPSGPAPDSINAETFARLPLDQKREHLRLLGALGR